MFTVLFESRSISNTKVQTRRRVSSVLIERSPVRFRARSRTGVMDYDEACFMHLTPGVVHNFPKAVGV